LLSRRHFGLFFRGPVINLIWYFPDAGSFEHQTSYSDRIPQMSLGSERQSSHLGSPVANRNAVKAAGRCHDRRTWLSRAADGSVFRPQGAPLPLFVLPADTARVKPELAVPAAPK